MKEYSILVLGERRELPDFLQAYDLIAEQSAFCDLLLDWTGKTLSLPGGNKHSYRNESELEALIENLLQDVRDFDFTPQTGIAMLGGSEKLFRMTLSRYLDNYANLETEILNWVELRDFASIREAVHKIKGFSLYLGSTRLHDVAAMLEEELANGKHTNEAINYFLRLHRRISKYCQKQVENV
jgi:HPt (histidine-containing phosphotransfer) domain-containing protein